MEDLFHFLNTSLPQEDVVNNLPLHKNMDNSWTFITEAYSSFYNNKFFFTDASKGNDQSVHPRFGRTTWVYRIAYTPGKKFCTSAFILQEKKYTRSYYFTYLKNCYICPLLNPISEWGIVNNYFFQHCFSVILNKDLLRSRVLLCKK